MSTAQQKRRPEGLANYKRKPVPKPAPTEFKVYTRAEIQERLEDHHPELLAAGVIKGKTKIRDDFAGNVHRLYDEFRKTAMNQKSGSGRISWSRLAEAFYDDLDDTQAYRRKANCMRRWAAALRVMGIARIEPYADDDGAWRCIEWELLPVDLEGRRGSSVGRAHD